MYACEKYILHRVCEVDEKISISINESDKKIELDESSSETQHVTKHGCIIHIKTRKNIEGNGSTAYR